MNTPLLSIAPIYRCPLCCADYKTEAEAIACYSSTPEPVFKVGDIVTMPYENYRWNDGLDHWVVGGVGRVTPAADSRPFQFYYVITSIDVGNRSQCGYNLHRPLYSIRTLAIKNGMEEGRCGWNSIIGHMAMELIENPPAQVVEESKRFLGQVYTNLI